MFENWPEWMHGPLKFVVVVAVIFFLPRIGSNVVAKEVENNKKFDAPDDHQIRWHIRHLRADVAQLTIVIQLAVGACQIFRVSGLTGIGFRSGSAFCLQT